MAKYKVQGGQNLFDIALHLYGTIEGLFDLLISNEGIGMNTELLPGMELEYHENFVVNPSIVQQFAAEGIVPANGERHVYHKQINKPLVAIIRCPNELDVFEFSISGEGQMIVDWGDNSELEAITLTHTQQHVEHFFDNEVDQRRIRWYGTFSIMQLDATNMEGDMYLTNELTVDEFISKSNDNVLVGLFLFKGTKMVNLERMLITDLRPIYDMNLTELNLLKVRFQNNDILNDYLVYVSEHYSVPTDDGYKDRDACIVYLDTEPSAQGMAAIQKIISEPAWNTPTKWEFHINDKIYTASDGENIN